MVHCLFTLEPGIIPLNGIPGIIPRTESPDKIPLDRIPPTLEYSPPAVCLQCSVTVAKKINIFIDGLIHSKIFRQAYNVNHIKKSSSTVYSQHSRIVWETTRRKSAMDISALSPSRKRWQSVLRRDWCRIVSRQTCLAGGCPRANWTTTVVAIALLCCMASIAVQTNGCAWPTSYRKPLFQLSHSLFVWRP